MWIIIGLVIDAALSSLSSAQFKYCIVFQLKMSFYFALDLSIGDFHVFRWSGVAMVLNA